MYYAPCYQSRSGPETIDRAAIPESSLGGHCREPCSTVIKNKGDLRSTAGLAIRVIAFCDPAEMLVNSKVPDIRKRIAARIIWLSSQETMGSNPSCYFSSSTISELSEKHNE
jgi:hypothetical protein